MRCQAQPTGGRHRLLIGSDTSEGCPLGWADSASECLKDKISSSQDFFFKKEGYTKEGERLEAEGFKSMDVMLVWPRGLSASLRTERSPVPLPVRAHSWVVGQVPSLTNRSMFLSLSVSLFLFLKKINK